MNQQKVKQLSNNSNHPILINKMQNVVQYCRVNVSSLDLEQNTKVKSDILTLLIEMLDIGQSLMILPSCVKFYNQRSILNDLLYVYIPSEINKFVFMSSSYQQTKSYLLLIYFKLMKQKQQRGPNRAEGNEQADEERKFSCTCGKLYKSKPAVYTHIKTIHNNDKINFRIIDSTKGQIQNTRAFRLDYIKFPQKESKLMTIADNTFVKMATALSENDGRLDKYVLDDDYLSDSDQEEGIQQKIQTKMDQYIKKYDLEDLLTIINRKYRTSLQSFQSHRYKLSIRTELTKFFKISFAWKIETQIMLYFARLMNEGPKIQACQANLWQSCQKKLEQIIKKYCEEWQSIRA